MTSCDSDKELENLDRNFIFDENLIICENSFFERNAKNKPVRTHVAVKITIPLKSKNQIPKKDIINIPTAL